MEDNKLHTAYVCREFGPVTGGGIGTYIYNVCMAMAGRGHKVFLVTDCFMENNLHLLPDGIELISILPTRENRRNSFISTHHEYSYRVYDTLVDLVSKSKLEVVEFAEFGVEGFATIRAKRLLGEFGETKLIVKLHTPSSLLYEINEDRRLHVDSLCDYYMEDYCVKHADMVTSPSLSLGEYFRDRLGRADIKKCPYPMKLPDNEKARSFSEKQIKTVRLIGSVQVRKGVDIFIKAAIQVLDIYPDFRFEIWGADRSPILFDKTYTQICERMIPDKYTDRIIFSGGIPYNEIPALFRESCICIYPSRWENWANVCLEAMSYGCVVLASENGGMSEMIEHERSGFAIDPLDPDAISSIILEYSDKPDRLKEISHQAQIRSRVICDPEKTAEKIEQNYSDKLTTRSWQPLSEKLPLISVIIPFFNQHQFLEETIASVRNSSYENVEIVVVNDGSTDPASIDLFESLTGVTKVPKTNGGLSSARNAGIDAAGGEFILPLDADDLLNPDYLSIAANALLNNPELGYVSCHAQNFGVVTNAYVPIGYVAELMPYINTHGKCCNLYRKEIFSNDTSYDEIMTSYEDWDFLLTLDERGIEGDVIPDEMFHYRRHFDSMVYTTANRQRADLIQYMMIKHEKALAPHAAKMAIMLARLWKESELRHEFAEKQIANMAFSPDRAAELEPGNTTRCQVYSRIGGSYWEHNSVYVDYPVNRWHSLVLNLPFTGQEGVYRLDPSNQEGSIHIDRVKLVDKRTGKTLFRANQANNFEGLIVGGTAVQTGISPFFTVIANGEDPQIHLPSLEPGRPVVLSLSLYFDGKVDGGDEPVQKAYRKWAGSESLTKAAKRLYHRLADKEKHK